MIRFQGFILRRFQMIKSKKCSECDNPVFSKGFCRFHQPKKSIKKSREQTVEKKKETQDKRNVYFDYHINRCTHSEESKKPINNPTRANICHILPKSLHPSLQDNLDNCILLTFSEHERFDKLLFSLEFNKLEKEFKNSWDNVCFKIKYLLYLSEESSNLSRELEKYINGRSIES